MIIYALIDPRGYEIRYVGKTKQTLDRRVSSHIYFARRGGKARRFIWLRKLDRLGLAPIAVEVQKIDKSNWQACEVYWISYFKKLGCDLVNGTAGGDGTNGYVRDKWTNEQKERQSNILKQRFSDPQLKSKISITTKQGMAKYLQNTGDRHSQRVTAGLQKRYSDPNARLATGIVSKEVWSSVERRNKLSEKQKMLIANEVKVTCPVCGLTSRKSNITRHRKIQGH